MKRLIIFTTGLIINLSVYSNDSIPHVKYRPEKANQVPEINLPEGFDNNLDSMLRELRAKVLSQNGQDCLSDSVNPEFPDEVITKRLSELPTIIPMPFNKCVRQCIDMYSARKRTQVSIMLGISNYYFPIFEQALEKYNMPNELKYLSVIESALNPCANSWAGAAGLWQFVIATGKSYGLEVNSLLDERRDPIKSTDAAVRYLKDLYNAYGDWHLAIAAYNCGPGNVNKAIKRSGGKRNYWDIYYYLPRETRGYVPLFIAANYVMTYYKEHLICPLETSFPINIDTIMISNKMHFDQISAVIGLPKENLMQLNPQYRHEIIPGTPDKPFAVCMPANYTLAFIDKQDSIAHYMSDSLLNTTLTMEPTKIALTHEKSNKYQIYRVRRGDTLSTIANHHNISINNLKRWNNIRTSIIHPGMRLKIY